MKKCKRWMVYQGLKRSRATIFAVGCSALHFFRQLEFAEHRITNLPIFVEIESLELYRTYQASLRKRYALQPHECVLSAGSRLIQAKGYDLLIQAIGLLVKPIQQHIKLILVGNGVELLALQTLITALNLTKQIIIVPWLLIADFKAIIANSDMFIHPARFDAYGGTTLAMALGVPVIGSYQAGAALDRIEHGVNGFLYDCEDIQTLADYITLLYSDLGRRKQMGAAAYQTALQWPPHRGKDIIVDAVI